MHEKQPENACSDIPTTFLPLSHTPFSDVKCSCLTACTSYMQQAIATDMLEFSIILWDSMYFENPNVNHLVPPWQCCTGITQRMTRSAASQQSTSYAHGQYPCFHPLPESQPVLPCLLRRLLQKGKTQEALSLATSHSQAPHFARSLEWLLFTSLEINNEQMARPSRCAACLHHPGLLLAAQALLSTPNGLVYFCLMLAQLLLQFPLSNDSC